MPFLFIVKILFTENILSKLSPEMTMSVMSCIENISEIQEVVLRCTPGYVIIDLYSRNFEDNALDEINKFFPGKSLILITTVENKHISYYHYLYGIKHFLYAEESSEAILEEINDIFADKPANGKFRSNSNVLTARECEILKLIASGMTSKEIADLLCISKNTVDTHRNKMLQKLNLANSASLVHYAYKSGLF